MDDDEYMKEWSEEHPCPTCGGPTRWDPDCPGWGKPVMVCYPYCGNAHYYSCVSEGCDWWWREPNRRSADGMGPEPMWLEEAEKRLNF